LVVATRARHQQRCCAVMRSTVDVHLDRHSSIIATRDIR
jgi:hypothetical protein